MSAFDWLEFLEAHGVDHEVGPAPKVRRDHVGILCPYCAGDDRFMFSIRLTDGQVRGCWLDSDHWMSPTKLIAHLARVDYERAKKILNTGSYTDAKTPAGLLAALTPGEPVSARKKFEALRMPKEFERFTRESRRREKRFRRYLKGRGFPNPFELTEVLGVRWTDRGRFGGRIIFPLWRWTLREQAVPSDPLVGWTGRTIGTASLRYKAHPEGDSMGQLLYESRRMERGDTLVVVEGPTDVARFALAADATVVGLMTNEAGPGKLSRLLRLCKLADRTMICLDEKERKLALRLQSDLALFAPEIKFLPSCYDDPCKMPADEVPDFLDVDAIPPVLD